MIMKVLSRSMNGNEKNPHAFNRDMVIIIIVNNSPYRYGARSIVVFISENIELLNH